MLFHIVAADGTGAPRAFWNAPLNYTRDITRKTTVKEVISGGSINCAEPVQETDRVIKGSGVVVRDFVADCFRVQNCQKTLWLFADGDAAWHVRIFVWNLKPIGAGHFELTFDLRPVLRLTRGGVSATCV